jgi:hypothetical protein
MATSPMMFGNPAPYQPVGGMNMNPTGTNGNGGITPANPATPASGFMGGGTTPPTGSPGNYGYGTSANPNSTATGTGPSVSMDPTGSPSSNNVLGLTNPNGSYSGGYAAFGNDLGKVYGSGIGQAAGAFLDSGGGYNSQLTQQAVQAQTQEMQLQANTNYGNLQSGLGAAGINPNSSAAALENSNFWSQTTTAENAMDAQEFMSMWQSSMQNETSILGQAMGGAAAEKMNQPTAFDWAGLGLTTATAGANLGYDISQGY